MSLSWAQNGFLDDLDAIDKDSTRPIDNLVSAVTKAENSPLLNPKEKTGQKNLTYCLTNLISYSQNDWLQLDQINIVLKAFSGQGMNFSNKEKGNISEILLQQFIYNYEYKYQNIGMLLYEALIIQGYDPYFSHDKKSISMFDYAIEHVANGSEYLDIIIRHINFNKYEKELKASPYLWLCSNPNKANIATLDHLIYYDKDLDINQRSANNKTTAFDRAIALNNVALCKVLIAAGIDLSVRCTSCASENYLHRLALYQSIEVFRQMPDDAILALINQEDINGKTPIFWALENDNPHLAIAYAKAGADLTIISKDGRSVMDVAMASERANSNFIINVDNIFKQ